MSRSVGTDKSLYIRLNDSRTQQMEQRERSHACLSFAESRQKKATANQKAMRMKRIPVYTDMKQTTEIGGRECLLYTEDEEPQALLIQTLGAQERGSIDSELSYCEPFIVIKTKAYGLYCTKQAPFSINRNAVDYVEV